MSARLESFRLVGMLSFNIMRAVVHLQVRVPTPFVDRDDLLRLVGTWRAKFPFLDDWCFTGASRAWDQSVLTFNNYEKPEEGEFSPEFLVLRDGKFGPQRKAKPNTRPFETLLPALAGGITVDHAKAIEPLNGVLLSEFALHFCATFILSSLVRYRPQIWQHALSHSAFADRPTDDRALSLIEKFLEIVLAEFPKLVEKTIDWRNSHDLRVEKIRLARPSGSRILIILSSGCTQRYGVNWCVSVSFII
jgi:hypothetical protein